MDVKRTDYQAPRRLRNGRRVFFSWCSLLAGGVDRPLLATSMNPLSYKSSPQGSASGRYDEQFSLAIQSPETGAQWGTSEGPLATHTRGFSATPCHPDPLQPFCNTQLSRHSGLLNALINSVGEQRFSKENTSSFLILVFFFTLGQTEAVQHAKKKRTWSS